MVFTRGESGYCCLINVQTCPTTRSRWPVRPQQQQQQRWSSLLVAIIAIGLVALFCPAQVQGANAEGVTEALFKCSKQVSGLGATIQIPAVWTKTGEEPLNFRLESGFGGCKSESFLQVISPAEEPGFNKSEVEYVERSGLLRLHNQYYAPREYCVQERMGRRIYLKICKPTCSSSLPCIAKCCSVGKVFEYPNGCVPVPEGSNIPAMWKPRMYAHPRRELTAAEIGKIKLHLTVGQPMCQGNRSDGFEPLPSVDLHHYGLHRVPLRLRRDGSLLLLGKDRSWEARPWEQFCTDDLLIVSENGTVVDSGEDRPFIVMKCYDVVKETGRLIPLLYVTSMFVSAFFLLITALVYLLLWDKHNVHGWTISCHVTSMFFLYVFLGVSHVVGLLNKIQNESEEEISGAEGLLEYEVNESEAYQQHGNVTLEEEYFVDDAGHGLTTCWVIGVIVHLFFISTFCWLTLINFDLWSTFKSHKPVGERSKGIVRFLLYNLFAWGVPAIVVGISITLDTLYPDPESEVIVPEYGQVNCFIAPWAMGYYVYTIIGVLMIINVVFIVLTTLTIYRFRETTRMVDNSRSGGPHQSLKLFAKLFVVMGVNWIFEIISWLMAGQTSITFWVILDYVNICQAIAIFIIFICKEKTYNQLRHKFPMFNKIFICCGEKSAGEQTKSSAQSSTKRSTLGRPTSSGQSVIPMKTIPSTTTTTTTEPAKSSSSQ